MGESCGRRLEERYWRTSHSQGARPHRSATPCATRAGSRCPRSARSGGRSGRAVWTGAESRRGVAPTSRPCSRLAPQCAGLSRPDRQRHVLQEHRPKLLPQHDCDAAQRAGASPSCRQEPVGRLRPTLRPRSPPPFLSRPGASRARLASPASSVWCFQRRWGRVRVRRWDASPTAPPPRVYAHRRATQLALWFKRYLFDAEKRMVQG